MPELQLKALPLLGGFRTVIGETELKELAELTIVSIAIPQHGEEALTSAIAEAYGASMPPPGESTLSTNGKLRFLWTARDQLFVLIDEACPNAADGVSEKLAGKAYTTQQTDNWITLRLAGNKAREALGRICRIDLHPSVFPQGRVARTVMEHMGVIILHELADTFLLLSASSTANSFVHAVETSLQNVS